MATSQLSENGNIQFAMIIVRERDLLMQENQNLKLQIANINGQKEQLERLLSERDQTIEEIKKENEELKIKVKELTEKNIALEKRVTCLEIDNCEIRKENTSIKKENIELKQTIKKLNDRLDSLETKQIYKIFLTVFQDINDWHQIEKGSDEPFRTFMKNIHSARIEMSHYIDNNDKPEIKEYKCIYVLNKLDEMLMAKDLLNKRAKSNFFMDKMIEYLQNIKVTYTPSDEEIIDIENWWVEQL